MQTDGRRLAGISIVATLLICGCAPRRVRDWDRAREQSIEPINSAVHRHLPRNIRSKDLAAVLEIYATETGTGVTWDSPTELPELFTEHRVHYLGRPATEPIRIRYQRLFELFETIDKAEVRIHRVHWRQRDAKGYPADLHFLIRGVGPEGERSFLSQWAEVHIDERDGRWVLTDEVITSRELISTSDPRFDVATDRAELHDVHETSGSPVFRLIGDMEASSGSAVGDFNCDGFEDVALLSSSRLALYRNNADGTFTDVAAEMGVPPDLSLAGSGLVFFDADNDGDPDLWLCGVYADLYLRNDGCTQFVDVTLQARLKPSRWSSMPVVADYDRDGFLDVYVVRMGDHEKTAPSPNWDARNGVADTLYRNNGDGTFSDATATAGIDERGWGLAGAWGDYNNDGYPDIYVGNEFGFNSLYRNDQDGTFTEVAREAGVLDRGAAMGIAWGDYDNDGNLDLYVSNMYANSRWALFHPTWPSPLPWYLRWVPRSEVEHIVDELTRGSTLLRNNGDGTFTDVSDQAGIRDGQWGWGAEFFDYNNDGRLDIYAVNGFRTGQFLDDV